MGTATYPRLVAKSQSFARVASLAVVLSGCLVLLGWIYDITAFKSVLPGLVTIKVNAALCFILAGIALRLVAGKGGKVRTWIARACALTVAGFGLATLSQDLFG